METKVPFLDLGRIHAPLKQDILNKISEKIDNSSFVLGPDVSQFEENFANYIGAKYCVAVSSGYDALKMALAAFDIAQDDEVITAANTFIATAYAISSVGANPVLVDVEENTLNIDPALIASKITNKTKAIIPVHLYGQSASMQHILDLAKKHNLKLIEDTAQSHGAYYQQLKCGNIADIGCFSFYPGKNLGAMGEGGAITTNSEEVYEKLKILRDVGQKEKYQHQYIGFNCRIHSIQAAILDMKLIHMDEYNRQRKHIAKQYREAFQDIKQISFQNPLEDRDHIYHLFIIHTESSDKRQELKNFLQTNGIQSGIHYPIPIHLQECYKHLNLTEGNYPITERSASTTLSLPIFPGMTNQETELVIKSVRKFFHAR